MAILVLGLILFFGPHLIPMMTGVRGHLLKGWGEKGYKGAFSLASLAGLVLIVIGYAWAPATPGWIEPRPAAIHSARVLVPVSFMLLAAANMKTHIRRIVQHPMLIGVALWSGVHLLANSEAKATVLFGSFFAYAIVDLVSAIRRHAVKPFVPQVRQDAMAVLAGILLALLVMAFHRPLFGVAVVPWGI